jgi:hypothetical protein
MAESAGPIGIANVSSEHYRTILLRTDCHFNSFQTNGPYLHFLTTDVVNTYVQ